MLAYGPEGVVAAVYGSTLFFLDATEGRVLDHVVAPHGPGIPVACMQWSPQPLKSIAGGSSFLLATGGADRRVRLWRAPPRP